MRPAEPFTEPDTRYARSGDLHIAYQTFGAGPIDVVIVPGFVWHLEYQWEEPRVAAAWRRLASFSRVIMLDKRGTGLSDRVPNDQLPTLEERMDDVRAVMDAAGSERAAFLGFWEGGPMCALFAATYPERTRALVLYGAPATFRPSPDHPWGWSDEETGPFLDWLSAHWGEGKVLGGLAPSDAHDARTQRWLARMERTGASPGAAIALWRMNREVDVRDVLPAIRVPTLVVNRRDDPIVPVAAARYLAARIPNARFLELPGDDHFFWSGDMEGYMAALQEFVSDEPYEWETERVLTTVLFVDIVGSTQRAAELGDRRWAALLADFYEAARRELALHQGRQVNTTGDGLLARFDGPARGIRCAAGIVATSQRLGLEVRAGLHTGECELRGDDLGGIAVHIGARIAALAAPGEVLVSSTVKDLVAGSGLAFAEHGRHALRGVPGAWSVFRVA